MDTQLLWWCCWAPSPDKYLQLGFFHSNIKSWKGALASLLQILSLLSFVFNSLGIEWTIFRANRRLECWVACYTIPSPDSFDHDFQCFWGFSLDCIFISARVPFWYFVADHQLVWARYHSTILAYCIGRNPLGFYSQCTESPSDLPVWNYSYSTIRAFYVQPPWRKYNPLHSFAFLRIKGSRACGKLELFFCNLHLKDPLESYVWRQQVYDCSTDSPNNSRGIFD